MNKRILSLVMVLAMIMSFVPVVASAATSGTCGDNLTWTLDDEGTLTISGTGAMSGVNVIVASYSNNKMLAMKSALVDIAVGENKINSPITDFSGADEIRVMV